MSPEERFSAVFSAVATIVLAEDQLRAAKRDLIKAIISLSFVKDRKLRLRYVRDLYWNQELNANALALALLSDNCEPTDSVIDDIRGKSKHIGYSFRRMIGPGYYVDCKTDGCSGRYYIMSRTAYHKQDWKHANYGYCDDCSRLRKAETSAKYERENAEYAKRKQEEEAQESAELQMLESKMDLSEPEKIRFYEIMSKRMADRGWE